MNEFLFWVFLRCSMSSVFLISKYVCEIQRTFYGQITRSFFSEWFFVCPKYQSFNGLISRFYKKKYNFSILFDVTITRSCILQTKYANTSYIKIERWWKPHRRIFNLWSMSFSQLMSHCKSGTWMAKCAYENWHFIESAHSPDQNCKMACTHCTLYKRVCWTFGIWWHGMQNKTNTKHLYVGQMIWLCDAFERAHTHTHTLERCSFVCCALFAVDEVDRKRVNDNAERDRKSCTRLALNERAKKFEIRVNEAR